ncbi:MAG: ATP-binding protein [Flavobacteriales bacterium]
MTALMVVSLIVIGAVTISYFKAENTKYHQERLARKERAIKTEMQYFSKEVSLQENMDVVIKEFEEEVLRLATVHNMEINVFNTRGDMLVSAKPDSLHSEYINRRVPPIALEQLSMTDRIVLPETKDEHDYLSDYTLLRNANGDRIAILNLPYERTETLDQNDLPNFLGSIGLTYLALFAAAIALTLILSNSITKNLSLLSERLRSTDFAKHNEPIEWYKNDEIGTLVQAYNSMLDKLEESRELLAKTEREGAWREMARQVAHEIKNPLTPVKLSIQHLQATSNFDSPEWREKFNKTMNVIIQQIESLNKIATEFSDFAKLHQSSMERVDVHTAIMDVVQLFADAPFTLKTNLCNHAPCVLMDPDALRRVLSNLIKNAKHAVENSIDPTVNIETSIDSNHVKITIEDNGSGIPQEIRDKVFQPNFTTKSSGTGLGLAICQQIVEQVDGSITFSESITKGTIFKIIIPILA